MENILLKQIVSMLIIVCMLTPLNGVIADDPLNKPDIELSFDECIHPTDNKSDYTFILRMQNRGMNVAENISVIVYCGTPEDLLLNETITSLNPQQFHNLSFEWNNTPGDYQFFAIADEDNVINESNEQNNEDFFFLTVREEQYINRYSTYGNCRYTWREGEYFNDSQDFGGFWPQWATPTGTGTSGDSYAETRNSLTSGDWAEWDFDVDLSDTYYFWFRHRVGDQCSNAVEFYWDSDLISTENWYDSSNSGWKWTCIGNKSLSSGGTLKIVGEGTMTAKHYLNVDNILITNQENFTIEDDDPGDEGGDDYVIGSNTPPELSNGYVDLDDGCTETWFTYWVTYEDDEEDDAVDAYVYIDGVANNMSFHHLEVSSQTIFHIYNCSTQLSEGEHTYYFVFSDGYENDQLPESGTFSGPNVWAENYPPQLKYGGVDPDTGYTTDTFTFHVWYKDNESNAPEKKEVHYRDDSMWHTGVMSPTGQVNTDGFEKYECDASGFSECSSNVFYFLFNDDISNHDDTRFPESGYCNGPVVSENDPPSANEDSASTDENTAVWIDVLDNDEDSDGLDLSSVTVTSGPSHGSTSVNTVSGEVEYVPDSGFYGSDSFTYTVDDNYGLTSDPATVTIMVNLVNVPPELSSGSVTPMSGSENTYFEYTVTYDDADGDPPVITEVFIDSEAHTMMEQSCSPGTPYHAVYIYNTTLPGGEHSYYFNFSDGTDYDRLPEFPGLCYGPDVSAPNIIMDSFVIDDDYDGESFGNDDGQVDGGETVELVVTFINNGINTAENVIADLSTTDGLIDVTTSSYSFGDLEEDESKDGVFVFDVSINHDTSTACFTLDIQDDGGGCWSYNFNISVFEWTGLNYRYVEYVSKELSNVIFTAYEDYEIAKGRSFGTKGERYASFLIRDWMNDDLSLNSVQRDPIDNVDMNEHELTTDDKLMVLDRGLRVKTTTNGEYHDVNCYICPTWNFTYRFSANRDKLTYNFSNWNDLGYKVKESIGYELTDSIWDTFLENHVDEVYNAFLDGTITDYVSFEEFVIPFFESDFDFTFDGIDVNDSDTFPSYYDSLTYDTGCYDFVGSCSKYFLFMKDPWNDPSYDFWGTNIMSAFGVHPLSDASVFFKWFRMMTLLRLTRLIRWNCEGFILFDHNMDCHNMVALKSAFPIIFINGTDGELINNSLSSTRVQYYLNQDWNTSVESYNVIGEIPGRNPEGTVIVGCLYDSHWCQGTTDAAIGMGMVLGIADYYKRHDIQPEWNLKFIAYGGEEFGLVGAKSYVHEYFESDKVLHVIDLNQLGFTERSGYPLTMHVLSNNAEINSTITPIVERTNYESEVDYAADFETNYLLSGGGGPSDSGPFAAKRNGVNTMLFLKDTSWTLHHRDGENHLEGDSFKYYNYTDVQVTADMILNVTKELANIDNDVDLSISDDSHNFGDLIQGDTQSISFNVWNSGSGIMEYILESPNPSCIKVKTDDMLFFKNISYVTGISTGEYDQVIIQVDTSTLSSGDYHYIIPVISDHETIDFHVFFHVLSTEPVLSFSPASFDFGSMNEGQTDSTSFDIWNSGSQSLDYTLNESCNWVTLSTYSGSSSGEYDMIAVDIDTTGLSPGSYHCDIDISSNGGDDVFGVDVAVIFDEVLDVNQSVFDRGFPVRNAADGDWACGLEYLPTVNTITRVELYLRKFGTPEFDLVVELREDAIDGPLVDTLVFTPAEIPSSFGWFEVDFNDTIVSPNIQYFIVCPPAPSGVTTSFGYEWGYALGDLYDDGCFWFTRDGGGLWRDILSYECTVKTYGLS